MKRLLCLGLLIASSALAADNFTQRVTPEEFRRAGLDKLSPADLQQLDALFQKYGTMAGPTPARPIPAAQLNPDAAAQIAQAEARARLAEQNAAAARAAEQVARADQKKAEAGSLAQARKVLVSPSTKVEVAALETQIDGWFDGWDATTQWRMADGSLWRVDNKPSPYQAKRTQNPRVKIYPAAMNGYWIEFPDLDLKLRVRPVNSTPAH